MGSEAFNLRLFLVTKWRKIQTSEPQTFDSV